MDTLLLTERIRKTIELGESQFREFKSAWEGPPNKKERRSPKLVAKDIAETLVAFANADGGELLVGVEDDGIVTGFQYTEGIVAKLLEAPRKRVHSRTPLDSPVARQVQLDEQEILYFRVEKSTTTVHQTSDGRCLQRKDLESRPVSAVELQFERQEQISREFDRQFIDGAEVLDLDLEVVHRVSDQITSMSPEKCLQYLGLADYGMGVLRLRRAALLLFAKDISRWHPRCQVRVVRVPGMELKTGRDYHVISDETATGNVLQLVSSAWEKLRPHLVETKMTPDALFKERVMYPEAACREALLNAIAHRDYSLEGQSIEILIFDDRMEVHSPGSLLSTIRIEELVKLTGIHESRNTLVARVLREMGYVREIGEGMRRIFRLMQDADLVAPELQSTPGRFSIILRHRSVFSETDQRWLDGFERLKLTRQEMLIALMGKDGRHLSPQHVHDRLGLVDWDVYREIIDQAYTKGIVYNAIAGHQAYMKARTKKVSKRAIPRLAVRQPSELEKALSELFAALQSKGPTAKADGAFVSKVLKSLSSQNPYRTDAARLAKLLELLGVIDDDRQPTSLLRSLWRQSLVPQAPAMEKSPVSTRPERTSGSAPVPGPTPVRKSPTRRPSRVATRAAEARSIFVNNLDNDTTSAELRALFSKHGNVASVEIPIDVITKRSRGFAIVKMYTRAEAERAFREINESSLRNRILQLNWGF